MRILYHHRTRAEDAQGIHIEEIQRAFRQLGHEVREIALVPRGNGAPSVARTHPLIRAVSRLASLLPRAGYEAAEAASNLVETARLRAALRAWRPDLIYERYSLHNVAGVLAARAAGVPLVIEVNAPLAAERNANGGLAFPRLAARIEAEIWKHADAIVTVSTPLSREIEAAGVAREKILVLPNAIRREMLTERRDGASVRARYGFGAQEVVCGFTGWFRPWHGLEALLESFADMGLAARGVRLLLVGEGQALPALKEIVARRGLGPAVAFAGAVSRDAIADHVAAFDVALQPAAPPYASPMKVFEYLAMGKPVVAAATPAIAEILTSDRDSILFAPGDTAAMVRGIAALATDGPLRARLAAGARETVIRRGFFWDENARRTLDHLSRLSGGTAALVPARVAR